MSYEITPQKLVLFIELTKYKYILDSPGLDNSYALFMQFSVETDLPAIPVSRLYVKYIENSQLFKQSVELYEAHDKNSGDLAKLRNLLETYRMYQTKFEDLQKSIEQSSTLSLLDFKPEEIAEQLDIISLALFNRVDVSYKGFIRTSSYRQFNDFIRFLDRLVISLCILPVSQTTLDRVNCPSQHSYQARIIRHLISTASILYQAHLNLACSTVILRALESPVVQKQKKLWSIVPSTAIDEFNKLKSLLPLSLSSCEAQLNLIKQLSSRHFRGSRRVWLIPSFHNIANEVHQLFSLYLTHKLKGEENEEILLSEVGERKLAVILNTLKLCRGELAPADLGVSVDPKLRVSPEDEKPMDSIGNLELEHWLMTRVFWPLQDLTKFSDRPK